MNRGYFLNPRPLKSGRVETALNISGFNSLTLYTYLQIRGIQTNTPESGIQSKDAIFYPMTSLYYKYRHEPSVGCFLVYTRQDYCIFKLTGTGKLKKKREKI